jgi:hypothetical protein
LRWLALEPLEYTEQSSKDPDFWRKWWREHHRE